MVSGAVTAIVLDGFGENWRVVGVRRVDGATEMGDVVGLWMGTGAARVRDGDVGGARD